MLDVTRLFPTRSSPLAVSAALGLLTYQITGQPIYFVIEVALGLLIMALLRKSSIKAERP